MYNECKMCNKIDEYTSNSRKSTECNSDFASRKSTGCSSDSVSRKSTECSSDSIISCNCCVQSCQDNKSNSEFDQYDNIECKTCYS